MHLLTLLFHQLYALYKNISSRKFTEIDINWKIYKPNCVRQIYPLNRFPKKIIDKNRFRTIFSAQKREKSISYDLERFSTFSRNRNTLAKKIQVLTRIKK